MKKINVPEKLEKIEIPLTNIVETKIENLKNFQTQIITIDNSEDIKEELEIISSIIQDIHAMKDVEPINFNILKFEFYNVKLSYQRYEIEEEIKISNKVSEKIKEDLAKLEKKQIELKNEQQKLDKQYQKAEERNNNLVYNLLGFLTAFSIVSAVVGVIGEIKGIVNIMLFMTFTVLILLTTLIGLHNFYKNNNKRDTKLQDNYFLWKLVVGIIIILFVVLGIQTMIENKDSIYKYIDNKIENTIEQEVQNKLNE